MDMVLYLRKETKVEWLDGYPQSIACVAYYKDEKATQLLCQNSNASRPTKAYKYVMYNCARYRIVWFPDKV